MRGSVLFETGYRDVHGTSSLVILEKLRGPSEVVISTNEIFLTSPLPWNEIAEVSEITFVASSNSRVRGSEAIRYLLRLHAQKPIIRESKAQDHRSAGSIPRSNATALHYRRGECFQHRTVELFYRRDNFVNEKTVNTRFIPFDSSAGHDFSILKPWNGRIPSKPNTRQCTAVQQICIYAYTGRTSKQNFKNVERRKRKVFIRLCANIS